MNLLFNLISFFLGFIFLFSASILDYKLIKYRAFSGAIYSASILYYAIGVILILGDSIRLDLMGAVIILPILLYILGMEISIKKKGHKNIK